MTHKERYTCKIYIISIHVGATVETQRKITNKYDTLKTQ